MHCENLTFQSNNVLIYRINLSESIVNMVKPRLTLLSAYYLILCAPLTTNIGSMLSIKNRISGLKWVRNISN